MMDIDDIDAVLHVSGTLESHGYSDAAHTPGLIADLFRWADNRAAQLFGPVDLPGKEAAEAPAPKAKRGKATESKDSDDWEATPDPSDEPGF
jgi:hypothetical protein